VVKWDSVVDPASSNINYTYADTNGYYSLIDHMLVSPQLVDDQRSVVIHVHDYNASDHYAISISIFSFLLLYALQLISNKHGCPRHNSMNASSLYSAIFT